MDKSHALGRAYDEGIGGLAEPFNPIIAGNGSGVDADGPLMRGLPCSASIVIPANGFVVFARDGGD